METGGKVNDDSTFTILAIVGIAAVVIVGPMFTIAALNTLFHVGIPLTLGTWAAALWLGLLVCASTRNSK